MADSFNNSSWTATAGQTSTGGQRLDMLSVITKVTSGGEHRRLNKQLPGSVRGVVMTGKVPEIREAHHEHGMHAWGLRPADRASPGRNVSVMLKAWLGLGVGRTAGGSKTTPGAVAGDREGGVARESCRGDTRSPKH